MGSKKWLKILGAAASAITIAMTAVAIKPVLSEAAAPVSGDDIARVAVSYLGTPYVSGGIGHGGVDCSGFVYSVLTDAGFGNVPRNQSAWMDGVPVLTYQGQEVDVQILDASSASYDAQPGDILVYSGHVCISMGRTGNWGDYGDIRSYVNALGGNSGLVFEDGSPWPVKAPWYRIHARSTAPSPEGRITGVEIDDTNTGSTSSVYAVKAYRIASLGGVAADAATIASETSTISATPVANAAEVAQNTGAALSGEATITNVTVSDVTVEGYRVDIVVENESDIAALKFPTWSRESNQADIVWGEAQKSGNTFTYYVNAAQSGVYLTHIHMVDTQGNLTIKEAPDVQCR